MKRLMLAVLVGFGSTAAMADNTPVVDARQENQEARIEQGVESEMLLAISRLDTPNPFTRVDNGNELSPGGIDFGQGCPLWICLVSESAIFIRVIDPPV